MASTETQVRTVNGNQYLAEAFLAYGVSHVFMVPTVAVPAFAAMESLGVSGIMTHGEKSAAYMADGYARITGRPGICMAQTIGSANLSAGLRDARMMGSPVIAMTGGKDPKTAYKYVYQEVEDFAIYESLTKWNAHVDDITRVPDMIRQAFRTATSGAPGPVHLEFRGLSAQVLAGDIEHDQLASPIAEERFSHAPAFRPVPLDEDIEAALEAIAGAERPMILIGGGARTSGAQAQVLAVAEKLQIPVATSLTAKGLIDETHPLAVGCLGASSRASANRTAAEADLVFVIGSHLGSQVTDSFRLPAPGTTVVQLDIDPYELGRNLPNTVSLLGDAQATLARMAGLAQGGARHAGWLSTAQGYVKEFRDEKEPLWSSDATPIRPERLCRGVTNTLPDDGVLVCDTGHSGIWSAGLTDLKPTQSFLRCGGSLGWAFPATLGAKCGVPDRPVVCFTGDGGFYYHLAELETAVRHGINAVIVVNNNISLSQDMRIFESAWGGPGNEACDRLWTFGDVSLAHVAETMGCHAVRVEDPNDVEDAISTALAAGRPAVVDVVTDVMALPDPPHGGVSFYSR